ncbi:hypothetical protein Fmac_014750 [Flemingia macrophylla]|uniref:Uncharacterized protein n=1 Tax=Flemingia macrophylla TaxID=520843 RepID=A0ABD1MCL7_9FABA
MKKPKTLPLLSIYPRDGKAEAFGVPSSRELGTHNTMNSQYACFYLMSFFVHGSIFWCPRRRGTTPIRPELGRYYGEQISSGDDGVGPVAQRIRARGYEPRCQGFKYLIAHNWPKKGRIFSSGVFTRTN